MWSQGLRLKDGQALFHFKACSRYQVVNLLQLGREFMSPYDDELDENNTS